MMREGEGDEEEKDGRGRGRKVSTRGHIEAALEEECKGLFLPADMGCDE